VCRHQSRDIAAWFSFTLKIASGGQVLVLRLSCAWLIKLLLTPELALYFGICCFSAKPVLVPSCISVQEAVNIYHGTISAASSLLNY
jgi:hypothetical protein